ncbi:protease modulator HflC [Pelagibius litoralis]|uniref:Protein HflC n=1 Tax=Pelagibius litoralis TaxID=374515 RepID=A0A967C8B3_9PROT|nr:protease modulator HflC [Pelagibius litoralis]NIA68562.1 protease modulator HflC [Pelagibius litoralis]
MGKFTGPIIGIVLIILGMVAYGSLFTVDERQQAIVMQFGEPKRVIPEPGLAWKMPLIQNVQYYENRVLNLDPPAENILLSDQKRLIVDAFARYKITDPLLFFQTVRTENVARQRLGGIINGRLRQVLGNETLTAVLSDERIRILASIRENVDRETQRFGIALVDVRIRRADLPDETRESVYDRMRSEREREAAEFRAQGFEQSQRITSAADREATVIAAEATRESEILRGQGEGLRTEILNGAYGQDPDFFNFYRSMQAYTQALDSTSTFMVLSPDSEFFSFFNQTVNPNLP